MKIVQKSNTEQAKYLINVFPVIQKTITIEGEYSGLTDLKIDNLLDFILRNEVLPHCTPLYHSLLGFEEETTEFVQMPFSFRALSNMLRERETNGFDYEEGEYEPNFFEGHDASFRYYTSSGHGFMVQLSFSTYQSTLTISVISNQAYQDSDTIRDLDEIEGWHRINSAASSVFNDVVVELTTDTFERELDIIIHRQYATPGTNISFERSKTNLKRLFECSNDDITWILGSKFQTTWNGSINGALRYFEGDLQDLHHDFRIIDDSPSTLLYYSDRYQFGFRLHFNEHKIYSHAEIVEHVIYKERACQPVTHVNDSVPEEVCVEIPGSLCRAEIPKQENECPTPLDKLHQTVLDIRAILEKEGETEFEQLKKRDKMRIHDLLQGHSGATKTSEVNTGLIQGYRKEYNYHGLPTIHLYSKGHERNYQDYFTHLFFDEHYNPNTVEGIYAYLEQLENLQTPTLLNYTKEDIQLYAFSKPTKVLPSLVKTYLESEIQMTRIDETKMHLDSEIIKVAKLASFQAPVLPDPKENTYLIVPFHVAQWYSEYSERNDLLVPDPESATWSVITKNLIGVKDKILGYSGFLRI